MLMNTYKMNETYLIDAINHACEEAMEKGVKDPMVFFRSALGECSVNGTEFQIQMVLNPIKKTWLDNEETRTEKIFFTQET